MSRLYIPKYQDRDNYLLKLVNRNHLIEIKCLDCVDKSSKNCNSINDTNNHRAHIVINNSCVLEHFVEPMNTMRFKRSYTDSVEFRYIKLNEEMTYKLSQVDDNEGIIS